MPRISVRRPVLALATLASVVALLSIRGEFACLFSKYEFS